MPRGIRGRVLCSVDGCSRPVDSHGLCSTHNARRIRTGSPLGTTRPSDIERFWSKVDTSSLSGCWPWLASLTTSGYASFSVRGRMTSASRFVYRAVVGPIPDGMLVCHRCDNPPCVRPDHLFIGTQVDNMRDMQAKGRQHYPGPRRRPAVTAPTSSDG